MVTSAALPSAVVQVMLPACRTGMPHSGVQPQMHHAGQLVGIHAGVDPQRGEVGVAGMT